MGQYQSYHTSYPWCRQRGSCCWSLAHLPCCWCSHHGLVDLLAGLFSWSSCSNDSPTVFWEHALSWRPFSSFLRGDECHGCTMLDWIVSTSSLKEQSYLCFRCISAWNCSKACSHVWRWRSPWWISRWTWPSLLPWHVCLSSSTGRPFSLLASCVQEEHCSPQARRRDRLCQAGEYTTPVYKRWPVCAEDIQGVVYPCGKVYYLLASNSLMVSEKR